MRRGVPAADGVHREAEMMRLIRWMALVLLVAAAGGLAACQGLPQVQTDARTEKPIDLGSSEVRQYEGKDLSSVADFRENSIKGPQKVPLDAYRLKVDGLVRTPLSLTYDEVIDRQSFKEVVTLNCVEGWSVDILWEGVKLTDILEEAGYDPAAATLVFHCYDGYTTSLPLKWVRDNDILLAYQMNGMDLPAERGYPFQVVAKDRYGYKWAKWVTRLEVSDDAKYQGYWEKRGYNNDALLPENLRSGETSP
jgi:DMSO/TMAO reductase YedYZ molybdopterin-dependent catalytic subunit